MCRSLREQRAAGPSWNSRSFRVRIGENFDVTEHLAFDQIYRHRRAVHRTSGPSRRALVKCGRGQQLAGAAFAGSRTVAGMSATDDGFNIATSRGLDATIFGLP